MSKRTKLVLAVVVTLVPMMVGALPVLAENQRDCGVGGRVGTFSSEAAKSGNGKQNGEFASQAARNSEPNFGQEISGPTGATNCAQKQL